MHAVIGRLLKTTALWLNFSFIIFQQVYPHSTQLTPTLFSIAHRQYNLNRSFTHLHNTVYSSRKKTIFCPFHSSFYSSVLHTLTLKPSTFHITEMIPIPLNILSMLFKISYYRRKRAIMLTQLTTLISFDNLFHQESKALTSRFLYGHVEYMSARFTHSVTTAAKRKNFLQMEKAKGSNSFPGERKHSYIHRYLFKYYKQGKIGEWVSYCYPVLNRMS